MHPNSFPSFFFSSTVLQAGCGVGKEGAMVAMLVLGGTVVSRGTSYLMNQFVVNLISSTVHVLGTVVNVNICITSFSKING